EPCNHLVAQYMPSTDKDKDAPKAMPEQILVRSSHNRHSTEIALQLESVDSHHPMAISALLDSGATGLFIDADFVFAKTSLQPNFPEQYQFTTLMEPSTAMALS